METYFTRYVKLVQQVLGLTYDDAIEYAYSVIQQKREIDNVGN